MSLSPDFDLKERVRTAIDIVDLVSTHLELIPQGRGYVARCPWHDDRRPSLQVNPQRQTWKCWVCDIGGDIFSYVMRRDGVDFVEALKLLAEKAGIEIGSQRRKADPGSPEDKATLLRAVNFAATAYFELLENGDSDEVRRAREYLLERGIDDESRKRFQIGFAPRGWSWLLDEARGTGISPEVLKAAGLAAPRKSSGFYDFFRGRIMFPIQDLQDRPISMGGRIIPGLDPEESGAKYINGPETRLYSKSRELYGLNLARGAVQRSGEVLVMEGYTDVIAARQAGIESVVAVLGTALGEQHINVLRRFVDRVVLVLDGDEAGRGRADQVLELFVGAQVDLRIITLPGGADPADFLAARGREALEQLAAEAPDALDHKLATLTDGVDLTRDTHRATAALEKMLAVLARGGDPNALRTSQMLVRLSRTFGVPAEDLREKLAGLLRRPAKPRAFRPTAASETAPPAAAPLEPIVGIDRELFEILIEFPETAPQVIEAVDPEWLLSESARVLMQVYQDLELQGREMDLPTVLLSIDDERLKGIVVGLDESINRRREFVDQPCEARLAGVLGRYRKSRMNAETRRHLARLEASSADDEGATELLNEIIAARRLQMGIHP